MDSFCEQGLVYCNFALEGVHFPGPVLVHIIVQHLLVSGSFEVVNVQFWQWHTVDFMCCTEVDH
jgi:hypothetical protein